MSGDGEWSCVREVLGEDLLSVILPVYRLGDTIEVNLDTVADCLDAGGIRYELVPVDDGSGDGTAEALRRAAAKRPDAVRPVWVEKNVGWVILILALVLIVPLVLGRIKRMKWEVIIHEHSKVNKVG